MALSGVLRLLPATHAVLHVPSISFPDTVAITVLDWQEEFAGNTFVSIRFTTEPLTVPASVPFLDVVPHVPDTDVPIWEIENETTHESM